MSYEKKRGFTLIELLIVVAIIAILAAIALPNFLEAQTRSKIARVKSDLRTLAGTIEMYRVDYNHYPADLNAGTLPSEREWNTWMQLTTPVSYMTTILFDPFQRKDRQHA